MISFGVFFALLAMTSWGFEELFLKESIAGLRSVTTFLINTLSGLLLQIAIVFIFFEGRFGLVPLPDFIFLCLAATIAFLGYIFFYFALEKQELSLISAIDESWIIISVLIGVVFFGESIGVPHIFSIAVILMGALLISVDVPQLKSLKKLNFIAGSGYDALSITFVGLSVPLEKLAIGRVGEANTIIYMALLEIPLIFITKLVTRERFVKPSKKLLRISISSGIADGLAFVFYLLAIKSSPVSVVAPIIASSVVVALFLARVYLKEKISRREAFGALMIIAGIIVLSSMARV